MLWLGEYLTVELCDNFFKCNELNDGIWNLSAPEWGQTLIETIGSLSSLDLVESCNGIFSECSWLSSLHSNLESFPWAKEGISNDLGTCR